MITVNGYFDQVIWIGSAHRPDRAQHLKAQLDRFAITAKKFEAHWKPIDHNGKPSGNLGCTASHRGVLELIAHHGWQRTLILEDDARFVSGNFVAQFDEIIRFVPDDWSMLYIGGHYGEKPQARVNAHCIRIGRMLTTHAYAVTQDFARRAAPHVSGIGPIDSLYGRWHESEVCYCIQPRLVTQYPNFSDLEEKQTAHEWAMLDGRHEAMV